MYVFSVKKLTSIDRSREKNSLRRRIIEYKIHSTLQTAHTHFLFSYKPRPHIPHKMATLLLHNYCPLLPNTTTLTIHPTYIYIHIVNRLGLPNDEEKPPTHPNSSIDSSDSELHKILFSVTEPAGSEYLVNFFQGAVLILK